MRTSTRRTDEELRTAAGEIALFAGADDEALDELCRLGICHDYPRNNILAYQGDPASSAYAIIEGRVKLCMQNPEGREVVLRLARGGDVIGLLAALDGEPQPANLITVTSCRLIRFDADALGGWCQRNPRVQKEAIRLLGDQLRRAYRKVGEHALMGVKERLLSTLLEIAEREGEPEDGGDAVLFTRPTHQELAYRIGSSREVVTRYLKEILASDLLQQEEGRVIRVPQSALVLRE